MAFGRAANYVMYKMFPRSKYSAAPQVKINKESPDKEAKIIFHSAINLHFYNSLMFSLFLCSSQAARRYCPHHVGHYLGMDVHDTPELSRSQPLQPGMAITIEPGKDELTF